jgi:hypothetical protein
MTDANEESNESDIIDFILQQETIINNIYNQYNKYKTSKYFYVPVDVSYKNGLLKTDVGDKSYSNFSELASVTKTWFANIVDTNSFSESLWELRNKNIVVMILVETEDYNFGSIVILPIHRTENIEIKRVCDLDIGPFNHMDSNFMNK